MECPRVTFVVRHAAPACVVRTVTSLPTFTVAVAAIAAAAAYSVATAVAIPASIIRMGLTLDDPKLRAHRCVLPRSRAEHAHSWLGLRSLSGEMSWLLKPLRPSSTSVPSVAFEAVEYPMAEK